MTLHEARAADSQTNWQRLRDMPDEAITSAAETDPDNPPLDDPFSETTRRPSALKKFTLAELLAGVTPENIHHEANWGKAQGKETQ